MDVAEWVIDHSPLEWTFKSASGRVFHVLIFVPAMIFWCAMLLISIVSVAAIGIFNYIKKGNFLCD